MDRLVEAAIARFVGLRYANPTSVFDGGLETGGDYA